MIERLSDWDRRKAESNRRKHGVSFREAASVFYDPGLLIRYDPQHSIDEERYIAIGRSEVTRILLVVHTERGEVTLIISARKATAAESRRYSQKR